MNTPKAGSDAAQAMGCTCPPYQPMAPDLYIESPRCVVHGPKVERTQPWRQQQRRVPYRQTHRPGRQP